MSVWGTLFVRFLNTRGFSDVQAFVVRNYSKLTKGLIDEGDIQLLTGVTAYAFQTPVFNSTELLEYAYNQNRSAIAAFLYFKYDANVFCDGGKNLVILYKGIDDWGGRRHLLTHVIQNIEKCYALQVDFIVLVIDPLGSHISNELLWILITQLVGNSVRSIQKLVLALLLETSKNITVMPSRANLIEKIVNQYQIPLPSRWFSNIVMQPEFSYCELLLKLGSIPSREAAAIATNLDNYRVLKLFIQYGYCPNLSQIPLERHSEFKKCLSSCFLIRKLHFLNIRTNKMDYRAKTLIQMILIHAVPPKKFNATSRLFQARHIKDMFNSNIEEDDEEDM